MKQIEENNDKSNLVDNIETSELAQSASKKLLILIVIATLMLILINVTHLKDILQDKTLLTDFAKNNWYEAEFVFIIASALLTMLGVPRLIFYGISGFVFGITQGLLLALCGSIIGSFCVFQITRWVGAREWVISRWGERRFFALIVNAKPTILSIAFVRLLPVSNIVMNFSLALSKAPNYAFILGSLIGFLPQGVVAVIIGHGVAQSDSWLTSVQYGVVIIVLSVVLFFKYSKEKIEKKDVE